MNQAQLKFICLVPVTSRFLRGQLLNQLKLEPLPLSFGARETFLFIPEISQVPASQNTTQVTVSAPHPTPPRLPVSSRVNICPETRNH